MYCSKCGTQLKPKAKFCHQCGTPGLGDKSAGGQPSEQTSQARNWLNSFGAFLFIPLFAIIIILLFFPQRESKPLKASDNAARPAEANSTPDMAAMEQVHKTLERLKTNIETNPGDLVSIDSLAVMYFIASSYEKSKGYYEMYLAVAPDDKDAKIGLALTHYKLEDTEKALSLLQEILNEDDTYGGALYWIAEIHASLHNHEEAKNYWQKIIDLYPDTKLAQAAKHSMEGHDK